MAPFPWVAALGHCKSLLLPFLQFRHSLNSAGSPLFIPIFSIGAAEAFLFDPSVYFYGQAVSLKKVTSVSFLSITNRPPFHQVVFTQQPF